MSHRDTLISAAQGVFQEINDYPPDEYKKLPALSVGFADINPVRHGIRIYTAPAVFTVYLVQKNSDGDIALDALRDSFLTNLFGSEPDWVWDNSTRANYIIGGRECRVEIMRLSVHEDKHFSG